MDWSNAMPVAGLIGGLMIGIAGAVMLLGLGRIAGVSGLAARATGLSSGGAPWPIATAFVVGLPIGAALVAGVAGPIDTRFAPSLAVILVGGLIVGSGTRLGSGCTSGHGVCGISRLSPRSLAATAAFMLAGFATVALMRTLGVSW
ncbi:MAG: YeeE/YedE family protein [Sphingomonas sp.]